MSETKEQIRLIFESYLRDEEKFSEKGNDAAGKRARAALLKIAPLSKQRRAEIQESRNSKKAEK